MATPKQKHEPAPEIAALPTPTEADLLREEVEARGEQYKELEAQWLKLNDRNKELTAAVDTAAIVVKDCESRNATQAQIIIELKAAIQTVRDEAAAEKARHAAQIAEAARDMALVRAELEDVAAQRDFACGQRDEALAQWEEWSKHPFFGAVYQLQRQCGEVSADLAEHVDRVICGVNDSGKAGKVTLVLAIKGSEEHAGALIAAAKVTSTIPKGDPAKAYFFMDNGSPTENDPRQKQLPIKADGRKPQPTAADKALETKLAKAKPVVDLAAIPDVPEYLSDDYQEALDIIQSGEKNVTAATLQRAMKLPFTRAALVFDLLKKRGQVK